MHDMKPRPVEPGDGVTVTEVAVSETTSIRLFRPSGIAGPVPTLLWIHGGGHLFGSPEQDDRSNIAFTRELGIVVAAVRYRLGADAPSPASLEDCHAALRHVVENAADLGVDPTRIAIGGASAGGGIAAALVLQTHDRGEIPVAFQLLIYPMLDDRTTLRTDLDKLPVRMWTTKSNNRGWRTYLGGEPGVDGISPYAAPARRADLSGLPPTWIGVGTVDLFYDEDVEYARRLRTAGVTCTLDIVSGAFHGFDQLFAKTPVASSFLQAQMNALRSGGINSR